MRATWEVRINGEVIYTSGERDKSVNVLAGTLYHLADDAYDPAVLNQLIALANDLVASPRPLFERIDGTSFELVRVVTL